MAASLSILILLIMMITFFSIRFSHADPRLDIVAHSCEVSQVQNQNSYLTDYLRIQGNIQDEMYYKKFSLSESGEPPNRLYALSECLNDLSNEECAKCFEKVSVLLKGCFPSTGGRVYLDGCFMRVSNYSFFPETIGDDDTVRCGDDKDADDPKGFGELLKKVLDKNVEKAPKNEGFAVVRRSRNGTTIYSMAQCWKTVEPELCSDCLEDAVESIVQCKLSDEGRALNAGCFLRYSTTEFSNEPDSDGQYDETPYTPLSFIKYVLSAIIIGVMAIAAGLCLGKITYKRATRKREKQLDVSVGAMQFKISTLEKATDCFSEAHKLGSGGYGVVYKGTLEGGREIAIKRLYVNSKSQSDEICNEVDVISKVQHRNLVRFVGGCFTTLHSFLVYEYVPNNSLDSMLFDPEKKKELDWEKRRRIIIGAAEGLEYLHNGCGFQIIHRDIKAGNILLDLKYKPKIADFGLARFSSKEGDNNFPTNVAGTFGYMAPEYLAKGTLTEKVDVYSFGVLMLEIVSGVKNTTVESDNYFETLVTKAWKHFQTKTTSRIIDETLNIADNAEEIKRVIHLGLLCTQEKPALRPTMMKLVQMLRHKDTEMPIPTKPPFLDLESPSSLASKSLSYQMYSSSLQRPLRKNVNGQILL